LTACFITFCATLSKTMLVIPMIMPSNLGDRLGAKASAGPRPGAGVGGRGPGSAMASSGKRPVWCRRPGGDRLRGAGRHRWAVASRQGRGSTKLGRADGHQCGVGDGRWRAEAMRRVEVVQDWWQRRVIFLKSCGPV
jgi:hypothetical protein